MPAKAKVPAIRFKGFNDAWEQRELWECFDERQERSAIGELISVTINDGIRKFEELGRHDNSSDDKSHYKRVEVGDIAYNSMRMWQGASGYSPYSGILSPAYTVIIPKDGVDSVFFSYAFKRPQMIHTFQLRSQGITSDTWNLKFPAFSEIETMLPTHSEQKKIGEYFVKLDNLITLHQRKLLKLKNVKKAMLEKMFPKNGSTVPEIRFAGFTDAWEQRELNAWADRYDNLRVPITASDRVTGSTPYYGANGIQDYVEGYTHDGEFILVAEDGASDLKNYPVQYVNGRIWVNNHAHVLQAKKEIADNKFLKYVISQTNIEPYLVGGGRAKLNADTMMRICIIAPENLEEQKQLGTLFQRLDNLITLHQRKYEKLQNLKKACLEKMFV